MQRTRKIKKRNRRIRFRNQLCRITNSCPAAIYEPSPTAGARGQQIPTGQQPPSAGQQAPMDNRHICHIRLITPICRSIPPCRMPFPCSRCCKCSKMASSLQEGVMKQAVNVQNAQFPSFVDQLNAAAGIPLTKTNMDLVMNVPLNISV